MIFKVLCTVLVSVLATYLLSLAVAIYAKPAFDYFYGDPQKVLAIRRQMERARRNIEEGVRESVYFYNFQHDDGRGVVAWQEGQTYGDYTFFYSAFDRKAYLVDFHGKVVHEWRLNTAILPPDAVSWPPPDPAFPDEVWRAFLQPNGDVIALYCGTEPTGRTSVAKGIFRVDKDSKLLWDHKGRIHHDVMTLPDGNLLTILEETRHTIDPDAPSLPAPFAEDFLATLDSKGQMVKKVSILDMFARSPQKKLLQQLGADHGLSVPGGDLFHTNTITLVTPEAAARNPALKAGEYMLSFRNLDMLAAVDLEQERVMWASYGPWHAQHSSVFLADGSVLMFDNRGNVGDTGSLSRILNVDTATGEILWEYDGTDASPVFSWVSSSVDPLPNGNVLVTESAAGRIFEVSRDRQIVWDYRAPQRLKTSSGALLIPNLFSGKRYRRQDLPFLND